MSQTDSNELVITLQELEAVGSAWREAHRLAQEFALQRNRLILRASELGGSRRRVAAAAGVTDPRVQQIIDAVRAREQ